MARPVIINDDLLLSTAREVFLEKGLRATTAEISERAGVSQGILFKRFKTKQALFRAAMNVDEDPARPLPIDLNERVGISTVEQNLTDLGNMLVRKFFGIVPTMMMDWSNPRQDGANEQSEGPCAQAPDRAVRGIRHVAEYLEAEAKRGRVRKTNYEILAQTFVGACWHYVFLQVMVGDFHKQPLTQEQFVEGVVQTLWEGVSPLAKR